MPGNPGLFYRDDRQVAPESRIMRRLFLARGHDASASLSRKFYSSLAERYVQPVHCSSDLLFPLRRCCIFKQRRDDIISRDYMRF